MKKMFPVMKVDAAQRARAGAAAELLRCVARRCNGRGGTKRVRQRVRFVELVGGRRRSAVGTSSDGSACRSCSSRRREWREGGEAGPRACQCISCAGPLLEQFVGHRGGPRLLSVAKPDTRPKAATWLRCGSPLSPCLTGWGGQRTGEARACSHEIEGANSNMSAQQLASMQRIAAVALLLLNYRDSDIRADYAELALPLGTALTGGSMVHGGTFCRCWYKGLGGKGKKKKKPSWLLACTNVRCSR